MLQVQFLMKPIYVIDGLVRCLVRIAPFLQKKPCLIDGTSELSGGTMVGLK